MLWQLYDFDEKHERISIPYTLEVALFTHFIKCLLLNMHFLSHFENIVLWEGIELKV